MSTDDVPEINIPILPPLNVSVAPENNEKTDDFLEELEGNNGIPQKKKNQQCISKYFGCGSLYLFFFMWFVLFSILERLVLGWQPGNNGGAIYVVIKFAFLIVCLRAIWKKIKSYSK